MPSFTLCGVFALCVACAAGITSVRPNDMSGYDRMPSAEEQRQAILRQLMGQRGGGMINGAMLLAAQHTSHENTIIDMNTMPKNSEVVFEDGTLKQNPTKEETATKQHGTSLRANMQVDADAAKKAEASAPERTWMESCISAMSAISDWATSVFLPIVVVLVAAFRFAKTEDKPLEEGQEHEGGLARLLGRLIGKKALRRELDTIGTVTSSVFRANSTQEKKLPEDTLPEKNSSMSETTDASPVTFNSLDYDPCDDTLGAWIPSQSDLAQNPPSDEEVREEEEEEEKENARELSEEDQERLFRFRQTPAPVEDQDFSDDEELTEEEKARLNRYSRVAKPRETEWRPRVVEREPGPDPAMMRNASSNARRC